MPPRFQLHEQVTSRLLERFLVPSHHSRRIAHSGGRPHAHSVQRLKSLAAFRNAGVGTLMVSPMAFTVDDRVQQLRAVAELAG